VRPQGFPFAFDVNKASDRSPGAFFLRPTPEDSSLPARLRQQVRRKAAKLVRYAELGKRGVLLLESSDIALMNQSILVSALRLAFPTGLPSLVQELWYADTSAAGDPSFHGLTQAVARAV
jgi:hypothetical protein